MVQSYDPTDNGDWPLGAMHSQNRSKS
ncbi:hypothetical protein RDI58_016827 [Solanum bulbocastanum]|uniref:Uncharacterized protein n=1 Tax=Solanum bulbocastanum TaxID=147425 RepID=A0AAN8TNH3_SOLBU